MFSKKASGLGPKSLKQQKQNVSQVVFDLQLPVFMDEKPIGKLFGDYDKKENKFWLELGDETDAFERIRKRNEDATFQVEYKNNKYPIKDFIKSQDKNYYWVLSLSTVKTAAIKSITYRTTKDLTDLIWGDRCASDLSDADLIRMTIGHWEYIFNDVFRDPKIETTLNIDKEVCIRLLSQALYESGLKDQERIKLIVGFAVKELFKPCQITSENKNLKD